MSRSLNLVIIVAVIAVAASAVNYYANFLPDQKIKQEETRIRMVEGIAQEKEGQGARIEDRYHKCMQEAENGHGDEIEFCQESCKAHALDNGLCSFDIIELMGNVPYANSKCPQLTPWQEQKVERDLKEHQDLCLKEMNAGVENP